MNKKQRISNRTNALNLFKLAKKIRLSKHICENCGKPGGHWVQFPQTLEDIINGHPSEGVWLCGNITSMDEL